MKKTIIVLLIALTVLGTFSIYSREVRATDKYGEEQKEKDLEKEIRKAIEEFLTIKGVNTTNDLTAKDQKELARKINEIKEKYDNSEANGVSTKAIVIPEGGGSWDYKGYVFVTGSAHSSIVVYHGHAGIGGEKANTVIEANPGDGVKVYADRISKYWARNNSSIMKVKNATAAQYTKAFKYANSKVGKKFGWNPLDSNDFYCSELVWLSWKDAGITLIINLGTVVTPFDLYSSTKTSVVKKYNNGY